MNKAVKLLIVVVLIATVGIVLALKHKDKAAVSEPVAAINSSVQATDENPPQDTEKPQTNQITPVKLSRLVDLGAGKCIPCKMMKPILDELRQEYKDSFEVIFIDVWENPDQAAGYKINLIPTQIFYDADGKELFRHEGFYSKEDILGKWKELGVTVQK